MKYMYKTLQITITKLAQFLHSSWRKILGGFFILSLTTASLFVAYYFYNQNQKNASALEDTQRQLENSKMSLLDKIKTVVDLPEEDPSMATVADVAALRNQPFFAKAQNDDVVLFFYGEGKALLYRPSENKIINWAFLDTGQASQPDGQVAGTQSGEDDTPAPSPASQQASIPVALYNGTTTTGLTKTAEEQLMGTLPEINIVTRANAAKNDYQKTIVVDITGNNSGLAKKLASELGGQVSSLPAGEATSSAQLTIILGKNFNEGN